MNVACILLIALLVPLGGCFGFDREPKYEGIGVTTLTLYHERIYATIWTNENPETYGPASEQWMGPYEDPSSHAGSFVSHCVREGDRSQENYVMDDNWIRVTIYESTMGPFGEEPGQELESKRWDGLTCFKGYTVVLTENLELELFRCAHCRTPEDREGLKPLTPSET